MFQTAEELLILSAKLHTKIAAILLTAAQIRRATEVTRAATESAILFQPRPPMREQNYFSASLFNCLGHRKYLDAAERRRFVEAASRVAEKVRLFCLTLLWSGARVSEVLALTAASIDIERGVVSLQTLKRRKRGVIRQVPLPRDLIDKLNRVFQLRRRQRDPRLATDRLWSWSRTTAWRRVKAIMAAAGIAGMPAMPKGLRHGFGVNAFQSNVPPHLVQRWLGHASLRTTSIYGDVVGPEERAFAARMWRSRSEAS